MWYALAVLLILKRTLAPPTAHQLRSISLLRCTVDPSLTRMRDQMAPKVKYATMKKLECRGDLLQHRRVLRGERSRLIRQGHAVHFVAKLGVIQREIGQQEWILRPHLPLLFSEPDRRFEGGTGL